MRDREARRNARSWFVRSRALVALAVAVNAFALTARAGADTGSDLERARAHVAAIEREADALTAQYERAYARAAELDDQLTRTQRAITEGRHRATQLRALVQERAVAGYIGGNSRVLASFDPSDSDILDAARRITLLDRANAPTEHALGDLKVVDEELRVQQKTLARARDEQHDVVASLKRSGDALQSKLAEAQREEQAIEVRFRKELAAKRRAEAAARRAEAARQAAAAAQRSGARSVPARAASTGGGNAGTVVASPPPGASIVCPVQGAVSFVDSWGAPRSGGRHHEGVDMMAARGTPDVAVVSGNVTMKVGNLSGNGVYLYGDDGNTYWYFHLDSWVGGPRHVSQGEVIGYVGDTGNARGGPTHTHFEYHPGGGGPVDPYPLVRSVC